MAATSGEILLDHKCACVRCDPSLRVDSTRRGPHHIGVRFWEENPQEKLNQYKASIFLNGERVEGVFEAVLGEPGVGVVWRYRGCPSASRNDRHLCLTCTRGRTLPDVDELLSSVAGVCTERLEGAVELRRIEVLGEG